MSETTLHQNCTSKWHVRKLLASKCFCQGSCVGRKSHIKMSCTHLTLPNPVTKEDQDVLRWMRIEDVTGRPQRRTEQGYGGRWREGRRVKKQVS